VSSDDGHGHEKRLARHDAILRVIRRELIMVAVPSSLLSQLSPPRPSQTVYREGASCPTKSLTGSLPARPGIERRFIRDERVDADFLTAQSAPSASTRTTSPPASTSASRASTAPARPRSTA
jgi:hypothetical protein